jgi:hypothetical protein
MSGRRSHARFAVLQSPEGVLRVLQDVTIYQYVTDHTIALSSEPGVVGELVSVCFPVEERGATVIARVSDSQPIVVDGAVKHQLRLHHLEALPSNLCEDDDEETSSVVRQ